MSALYKLAYTVAGLALLEAAPDKGAVGDLLRRLDAEIKGGRKTAESGLMDLVHALSQGMRHGSWPQPRPAVAVVTTQ